MVRRLLVRLLVLGALSWLVVTVVRLLRGAPTPAFDTTPAPAPAPASAPVTVAPWVDGAVAPGTHPVKAKLKSGIYHLPGMLNYERTVPDRWYRDAAAAEADGLRPAKR
jgi:hypothetical protein